MRRLDLFNQGQLTPLWDEGHHETKLPTTAKWNAQQALPDYTKRKTKVKAITNNMMTNNMRAAERAIADVPTAPPGEAQFAQLQQLTVPHKAHDPKNP